MDSQIGRELEALEQIGARENTVVVLWSDNGWHLGEKGVTGKNTLWDRSTKVPLIFAGPGVTAGAKCKQPAELLDIYPTLVALCDLPKRPGLQGHSLVPQLRDAGKARRYPAITTHNPGNDAIRTERWRYIRYADGSEELYDMLHDPDEWTNLAGDPRFQQVKRTLGKWVPDSPQPHAPESAHRVLMKRNGVWEWEGKPIDPNELEQ
jgi:arylsulfatase A-like enzyme